MIQMEDDRQHQICKVEASTETARRGQSWNGVRPDLVICDDLEDKRNTNTEQLRQELFDWFTKVVVPLGDPAGKKTAIIYMGTVVHVDALLIKVMKRTDFKTKRYKALIEELNEADLWECRSIYLDERPEDEQAEAAGSFLPRTQIQMDEAVVLWPEVQPLWKLMRW
ncbi:hypothetical protein [Paenibacillus larvae]|uniref:hypothetical protein n=1 Tax=Paenibacillus larvae TaxID=1464 RepID=UPI002890BBD9|nr:hypothetical protein [Paenibacillus larvae]MDT2193390.1 hypothetical protein [Paenibacillus larvae]